jgi:hypothetical protein
MTAQSVTGRGGLVLKLMKGFGRKIVGIRAVPALKGGCMTKAGGRFVIKTQIRMPTADDSTLLVFGYSHLNGTPRLWIKPKGNYYVWHSAGGGFGGRWVDTGITPTRGGWDEIQMDVVFGKNMHSENIVKGVAVPVEIIEDVRYDVYVNKRDGKERSLVKIAGGVRAESPRNEEAVAVEIYNVGEENRPLVSYWGNLTVRVVDEKP